MDSERIRYQTARLYQIVLPLWDAIADVYDSAFTDWTRYVPLTGLDGSLPFFLHIQSRITDSASSPVWNHVALCAITSKTPELLLDLLEKGYDLASFPGNKVLGIQLDGWAEIAFYKKRSFFEALATQTKYPSSESLSLCLFAAICVQEPFLSHMFTFMGARLGHDAIQAAQKHLD